MTARPRPARQPLVSKTQSPSTCQDACQLPVRIAARRSPLTVPVVFDCVVGSPRQELGDLGPAVAQLGVLCYDDVFLLQQMEGCRQAGGQRSVCVKLERSIKAEGRNTRSRRFCWPKR